MIYSILQSLDKDWSTDDTPHYWEGIVKDPENYATYKDVEHCLNNPQFFDLQFIDRVSNTFIPLPVHERCWSRPHMEQRDVVECWYDGHNVIINNFDQIDRRRQQIMQGVEETFPQIRASMHIYAGTRDCKSFKIHEDFANNFIIQVDGETHWRVYNNRASNIVGQVHEWSLTHDDLDCAIDVTMKPGDMLYIPARCYHHAQPSGKRLSVSIPMQHGYPHLKQRDRKWYEIV
ncbi:MAG: hypothetical protein CBC89_04970 [Euryarchaeota archaeon TMED129]|nr:MAG: hypothetical protein CBC89_04970 [Euryarchaeota archaeon TMED129]|tara:strand:- start:5844 stop:6539 length:696 start_codon:yes stop_codon:yes gene_type:complete